MGRLNPSREGVRRLGDYVVQEMTSQEMTLVGLVNNLQQVGFDTNVPKIQRLRRGSDTVPDGALLRAIAKLGFLKDSQGHPYSLDDFYAIACEEIEPGESPIKNISQLEMEEPIQYREAVEFIRQGMGNQSVKEFANTVEISPDRLYEILKGSAPDFVELLKLSAHLCPGKDADKLGRLYGFTARKSPINGHA